MTASADDAMDDAIDRALEPWRQGDCFVGDAWFVHRFEPANPLTEAARSLAADGVELAETNARGLVVLTQTCDLVRPWRERPYVEVSPLVEVENQRLHQVARGLYPREAYVPGVADRSLVADLDRVMTVEKAVVAGWKRIAGCGTDEERRRFAGSLARKRGRFAFPDDFHELASGLRSRVVEKHGRTSPEGRALNRLREIRVSASPDWSAQRVHVMFLFVRDEGDAGATEFMWDQLLESWLARIPSSGRFEVEGVVTTLDRLTAAEYVESDRLDLDHLTRSQGASAA